MPHNAAGLTSDQDFSHCHMALKLIESTAHHAARIARRPTSSREKADRQAAAAECGDGQHHQTKPDGQRRSEQKAAAVMGHDAKAAEEDAEKSVNVFHLFVVNPICTSTRAGVRCAASVKIADVVNIILSAYNFRHHTKGIFDMGQIRKREISDRQRDFVTYLVRENKNATEAARLAGYAHPKQSAYDLTRNPAIIALMRQARQTLYQADLANVAGETIRSVMLDLDAPASARVSAARTASNWLAIWARQPTQLANPSRWQR